MGRESPATRNPKDFTTQNSQKSQKQQVVPSQTVTQEGSQKGITSETTDDTMQLALVNRKLQRQTRNQLMKQRFIESDLPIEKVKSSQLPQDDSSQGEEEQDEEEEQSQVEEFADNQDPEEPLDPKSIEAVKLAFESRLSSRKSVSFFP